MPELENLKTSPELIAALIKSANDVVSRKELLEQRVSFIFSSVSKEGGVTREQIRKALVEETMAG